MEDAYVLQLTGSKFQDLYLCFCGMSECEPNHSFGPAVRPNYIIHYILSGKGIYQVGEERYELQQGQGFLIEPEAVTFYKADGQEPWTYLWIGFGGEQAEVYLQDLGLNSSQLIFQSGQGKDLQRIVATMLGFHASSQTGQYYLQSLLYEFFAVLTKDAQLAAVAKETKESIYVQKAINYIRNNYSAGISVKAIAEHVCVSRSYLYKVFEETLEMSPKDFLTQFQISRSKELLTVTDLSIEGVALSCGYGDALVYSKTFKKIIGMPPSVYRRVHREEVKEQLQAGGKKLEKLLETF